MTVPRYFWIVLLLVGCNGSGRKLNVQVVRRSSEILKCEKIFAEHLEGIDERNEILLQTGVIDTTNEHPPVRSAIVTIGSEVIFTLDTTYTIKGETVEKYEGKGYRLTLAYTTASGLHGKLIYTGRFSIEANKQKKEYEVEGETCVL